MGLAATQARLLFITSRQLDVSANMQKISNTTMSLARDEDAVYEKYNQMLNATTTQYTGTGSDISYANLMGINAATAGSLSTITDANGRVVVDALYATALSSINPNGSAMTYTDANCVNFIKAITGDSSTDWATLVASASGATNNAPAGTQMSMADILVKLTKGATVGASGWNDDDAVGGAMNFNDFMKVSNNSLRDVSVNNQGAISGYFATECLEVSNNDSSVALRKQDMSISTLYNNAGNYKSSMLLASAPAGDTPSTTAAFANMNNLANSVYTSIIAAMEALGLGNENVEAALKSSVQNTNQAYKNNVVYTDSQLKQIGQDNGWGWDDAQSRHNENSAAMALLAAQKVDGIVATRSYKEGSGDGNTWSFAVNAGKFVKQVLDTFMATLTGGANQEVKPSGETGYKPKDEKFTIKAAYLAGTQTPDAGSSNTNETKANFYKALYQKICSQGWVLDNNVSDAAYLNQQFANGTYYVNGTTLSNSDLFQEVADEEKRAEAETYYDYEMRKIQRKEQKLETELQKMQTEYSSLNTEYESVKSIISNNVQRSFTYFQQ